MKDVSQIRRDYKQFKLDEKSINKNPFEQFKLWLDEAVNDSFLEPTAFVLSTVSNQQKPSSRVLLLKGFDNEGMLFFSNYNSQKGSELLNNQYASMLFFWDKFERQIRIEGKVERISKEESENYFKSRPYTSRIGAWASNQSHLLKSRFTLLKQASLLMLKYKNDVPLPDFWGGYKLFPESFEFWQGRESRLHDRIKFIKKDAEWETFRLYP